MKAKRSRDQGGSEPSKSDAEGVHLGEAVEPKPKHAARLPEYGETFRRSLEKFDNRIVANAITLAGKIAAADPHAWRGVRKLRGRPDTLRQKVGRNHRLLFKATSDSIVMVDLIDRRDLDDWIRRG